MNFIWHFSIIAMFTQMKSYENSWSQTMVLVIGLEERVWNEATLSRRLLSRNTINQWCTSAVGLGERVRNEATYKGRLLSRTTVKTDKE